MVKIRFLKGDEVVVKSRNFGFLAEEFVHSVLRPKGRAGWDARLIDSVIRECWPSLDEYYKRHIITAIEVAIALDEPPRYNRDELTNKEMWKKIIADLRSPRSPFSIDYHCHQCKKRDIKLWRPVHGGKDSQGRGLLCAKCLAPDHHVDEEGKYHDKVKKYDFVTDQVNGWLPAVPVDDTYWSYTCVPSQDVEWWCALPTYPKV